MEEGSKQAKVVGWLDVAGIVSLLAVMGHVMVHFRAYIYKFHSLSLFDGSWGWFIARFDRPAALVTYVGRFLTQFCCRPVVGIALLLLLYAAITWMMQRHVVHDRRLFFLAALPALGHFLFLMGFGYEIYLIKADALIFTQPFGMLCSLLLFAALKSVPSTCDWRKALPVAAAIICYPLLGFYALLALLMYSVYALRNLPRSESTGMAYMALLSALLFPLLFHMFVYNSGMGRYAWVEGLPYRDFIGRPEIYLPLYVALGVMLLLCFFRFRSSGYRTRWWHVVLPVLFFAAFICSVYALPNRDRLFHSQLRIEKMIDEQDWEGVLDEVAPMKVSNDVLVAYRNCALYATGHLAEKCCQYPTATVPIVSGEQALSSSRVAGPTIFFHSGLVNFAARWSSELSLYSNYSTERMKYLAKTALINGETDLARKYISAIGRSTIGKGWARKYMEYADDPEKLAQDPEYMLLKPLQMYEEQRWMPSDKAAYDVLLFYSFVEGDSRQMMEWNLAAAMMSKAGNYFEEVYPRYEAALAAESLEVPEQVAKAYDFFTTLTYSDKDAADPRCYVYFFYNENFAKPN